MLYALLIMILGVGGVFVFLLVLIQIMQAIVDRLPPTAEELAPPKPRSTPATAGASSAPAATDTTLIAVLQAAVAAYEDDHRSN
jgi:sodium pump decarboxylase gamma subunit